MSFRRRYGVPLGYTNDVLITVFGKTDFITPRAIFCCVIWAFWPGRERTSIDAAGLTDPAPHEDAVPAEKGRLRHRRPLSRLSIQSKIMLILLVSSLASLGVIGAVDMYPAESC